MYKDIFKKSTDGMLIIQDDKFVDCNQAAVKMLRYKNKNQFLNKHPSEISPEFQPDGKSSFFKAEENTRVVIEKGYRTFEWVHLRADGEEFWVDVALTDISKDDKVIFLVVWREISEKKLLEAKNSYQRMILTSVMNSSGDLIFYKDYSSEDGKYIGCNNAFLELAGKSKEEIIGHDDIEIFGIEIGTFFREKDFNVIKIECDIANEEWVTYPNGKKILMHTLKSLLRDENKNIIGIMGISRNITNIYYYQIALKNKSDELNEAASIISKNVIHSATDINGVITDASEAFCNISGYSREELIGANHNIVRHPDMPSFVYEDLWKTIKSGKEWIGELKNRKKDGSSYWVSVNILQKYDASGKIVGYVAIRHDITAKVKLEELNISLLESKEHFEELSNKHKHLANTDQLTGILNRRAIFSHSDNLKSIKNMAVMMIDIDDFKYINDKYGHDKGDLVLKHFTEICSSNLRAEDTFGRLGGEEFMIILYNIDECKAKEIASRLVLDISNQKISDENISITISVGIAMSDNKEYESFTEILKDADIALYQAKTSGKNKFELFRKE